MKTHRTCGECRNGKLIDFVCTKKDIAVCIDSTCDDFIPKENKIKTCEDCALCIPINERHLDPYNSVCRVSACLKIRNSCDDFVPKEQVENKLEAAAKKAATTGNRSDLQAYLKLRREML